MPPSDQNSRKPTDQENASQVVCSPCHLNLQTRSARQRLLIRHAFEDEEPEQLELEVYEAPLAVREVAAEAAAHHALPPRAMDRVELLQCSRPNQIQSFGSTCAANCWFMFKYIVLSLVRLSLACYLQIQRL